jgi:hypothetical protein
MLPTTFADAPLVVTPAATSPIAPSPSNCRLKGHNTFQQFPARSRFPALS